VIAGLLLWATGARAELPLPAYDDYVARTAWYDINRRIEQARAVEDERGRENALEDALRRADDAQRALGASAGITHLTCEIHRRLDQPDEAEAACRAAIALAPDYSAPWYDLGEMLFVAGRLDEAITAFTEVARLEPTGPQAVLGPWRLAEVYAARGDAPQFEASVRQALERGFSFRTVACAPNWQAFASDPRIAPSMEKLVTVYGDPTSLAQLRGQAPCR
jgi:tetratricopeptide (TPR) repeat protein